MPNKDDITYFAEADFRNSRKPFGIKRGDRPRHMYVIGKTGMGKSTLLENMIIQDIKNGEGVAVMDPHGSMAEKLLDYVPEHRIKDVIYFDPFDADNPISFNVMEDVGADKRHLVTSGLISAFKKIWVDAWSGRMEYILTNTILALLEYPDATLLGVNRMLSDKDYRKKVVDNITDPSIKSFWVDEFAKYNERYMQEAGDAIKNKVGQFTANPIIRNVIGQAHSSFDIRGLMDEKKIFIMNLSKGRIGEQNSNLIGSMLVTKIYLAAMSRADMTSSQLAKLPDFYLYVDEFQSFANESFAGILSEARKYKLNLVIAHQYVEQMPEEVKNAVFGNVGTTISFRVGPMDAELLEKVFTPVFTAEDLVNLGFAQIYLTLMIDGVGSRPFSAMTLPPIPPPAESFRDEIIKNVRKNYARTRGDVEGEIKKWHEPLSGARSQEGKGSSGTSGSSRENNNRQMSVGVMGGGKNEYRIDNSQNNRQNNRQDFKQDSRQDNRQDSRQQNYNDNRSDNRQDNRQNSNQDNRSFNNNYSQGGGRERIPEQNIVNNVVVNVPENSRNNNRNNVNYSDDGGYSEEQRNWGDRNQNNQNNQDRNERNGELKEQRVRVDGKIDVKPISLNHLAQNNKNKDNSQNKLVLKEALLKALGERKKEVEDEDKDRGSDKNNKDDSSKGENGGDGKSFNDGEENTSTKSSTKTTNTIEHKTINVELKEKPGPKEIAEVDLRKILE